MFKMYRIPKGVNAMANQLKLDGGIEQLTNPIKVGDPVRLRGEKEYLGKVTSIKTISLATISGKDGEYVAYGNDLEIAPRLSADEAWAEAPFLVLGIINRQAAWGAVRLYESDYRAMRYECYKLLGGAGVKITDEVKERVRKIIARMAEAMGLELA